MSSIRSTSPGPLFALTVASVLSGFAYLGWVSGHAAAVSAIVGTSVLVGMFAAAIMARPLTVHHSSRPHKGLALPAGRQAELDAKSGLSVLPGDYCVLSNVLVPCSSSSVGSVEVDVMVIGPPGVFVIEVKSHKGIVAMDPKDAQWSVLSPYGSTILRNPVRQAESQKRAVREFLNASGMPGEVFAAVFMPYSTLTGKFQRTTPVYQKASFLRAYVLSKTQKSLGVDDVRGIVAKMLEGSRAAIAR